VAGQFPSKAIQALQTRYEEGEALHEYRWIPGRVLLVLVRTKCLGESPRYPRFPFIDLCWNRSREALSQVGYAKNW